MLKLVDNHCSNRNVVLKKKVMVVFIFLYSTCFLLMCSSTVARSYENNDIASRTDKDERITTVDKFKTISKTKQINIDLFTQNGCTFGVRDRNMWLAQRSPENTICLTLFH